MKAVILAGGLGTRLAEETEIRPKPMIEIGAIPAAGTSPGQVRSRCETLAEEVRKELGLSGEYRLTWLQEPSAR